MKTILIVDDEPNNQELYELILNKAGYETIIAINGQEGVAIAEKSKPDLILMDMRMPVMDGYAASRHLRNNPDTKNIPIIGISAHSGAEHIEQAMSAGCDEYLTKPCPKKNLLVAIESLLPK